jgi:hypothetical protein
LISGYGSLLTNNMFERGLKYVEAMKCQVELLDARVDRESPEGRPGGPGDLKQIP